VAHDAACDWNDGALWAVLTSKRRLTQIMPRTAWSMLMRWRGYSIVFGIWARKSDSMKSSEHLHALALFSASAHALSVDVKRHIFDNSSFVDVFVFGISSFDGWTIPCSRHGVTILCSLLSSCLLRDCRRLGAANRRKTLVSGALWAYHRDLWCYAIFIIIRAGHGALSYHRQHIQQYGSGWPAAQQRISREHLRRKACAKRNIAL